MNADSYEPRADCDNYCVIGDPIAHSRSPSIHAAFAAATRQRISYQALRVPAPELETVLVRLHDLGVCGINVTLPHKEAACALARSASERAALAGAANTLARAAVGWHADNTDGAGLVRDLTANLGFDLCGSRVLVLGAGGAARGLLAPLLALGPAVMHVANRNADRARDLAERFANRGHVTAGGYDRLPERNDLILNATSASLTGTNLPLHRALLGPATLCYDLMYAAEPTVFMRWATENGAQRAVDGLGMLVEQAAEAFLLWRGIRPETAAIQKMLRAHLLDP